MQNIYDVNNNCQSQSNTLQGKEQKIFQKQKKKRRQKIEIMEGILFNFLSYKTI